MPRGVSPLLVVLAALSSACSAFRYDDHPAAEFPVGPDPTLATDVALLEQFAPPDAAYTIGAGDKLTVDVWGRTEISGPHTVGPDGTISLPMAGALRCENLTRQQIETAITDALGKYYKSVAVTVRVDDYASNRVSVLGAVQTPGNYAFAGRPTLLSALSQAGGIAAEPKGAVVSPRCSVIRGRSQIVWIDLGELLWNGNTSLNIPLLRDDVVYVPDGAGVMVYVLGEVEQPGVMRLTPGLKLVDAIANAGGLTEDALAVGIRVLRPSAGSARADVDFEELLAGETALDLPLRDGDIVFVPTRKLESWNYFWRKINPFAGIFQVQQ